MEDLPPEVLEHFLLFLMPEEVGQLSIVCKGWADVIDEEYLWKQLFERCFGGHHKTCEDTWKKACATTVYTLYRIFEEKTHDNESQPAALQSLKLKKTIFGRRMVNAILGGHDAALAELFTREEIYPVIDMLALAGFEVALKRILSRVPQKIQIGVLQRAVLKCSEGGHTSQLEWVLSLEPSLEVNNLYQVEAGRYTTALLAAVENNHIAATRLLLAKGAKNAVHYRRFCSEEGRTCWRLVGVPNTCSVAVKKGYTDVVKLFLASSAKQTKQERARDVQGYLEDAVSFNHMDIVELLLLSEKDYCDVNSMSGLFTSEGVGVPLVPDASSSAADNILIEDVTQPTASSAGITNQDKDKDKDKKKNKEGLLRLSPIGPVLFHAAMNGDVEMGRYLVSKGADVNKTTPGQRRAAIHVACCYGHEDMVKFLVDNGAIIDVKTIEGATPLSVSLWKGHKAVIKLLQQELVKRKGKG